MMDNKKYVENGKETYQNSSFIISDLFPNFKDDNSQHIVINTVPYHPTDLSYSENDNKFPEGY